MYEATPAPEDTKTIEPFPSFCITGTASLWTFKKQEQSFPIVRKTVDSMEVMIMQYKLATTRELT
jgi:hypothetical protein